MIYRMPGVNDAQLTVIAIETTIDIALDVGARRAIDPGAYPILPPTADLVRYLTNKTLADLLALGWEPAGWERAYMPEVTA